MNGITVHGVKDSWNKHFKMPALPSTGKTFLSLFRWPKEVVSVSDTRMIKFILYFPPGGM